MNNDPVGLLYRAGASLFVLGAVTGLLVSASFGGLLPSSPEFMLAAHLNALMGCFWLVCVGVTWERVSLSPSASRWLVRAALLAAYGNWLVTLVKALLRVQGINYLGEARNDAIFAALTLTVVIPTFIASALWVRGLWGARSAS